MVNHKIQYLYGAARQSPGYNTGTSRVEHFFIKGDREWMGVENTPGGRPPGQVRTFKVDTNSILDCKRICRIQAISQSSRESEIRDLILLLCAYLFDESGFNLLARLF